MLKKIYTTLLAVVLIAGCKKDPGKLVGPTNQYSSTNYPTSLSGLQSVLAACYSNLRDPGFLGFWFLPKALSNSMHTVNSIYNGDAGWNEMANTNLSAGNQYSSTAWTVFYTGIKNCNVTIAAAALYNQKYAQPGDATTVNYVLGQAYFLRAFYYMELECLYGEAYMGANGANGTKRGVPLFTSVPTSLAETQQPRATVQQVWSQIEADCKQAATLLTGANWTGQDEGRVTKWAAEGLLGKAYVYTQDWADAKSILNDVITNSGKTLVPWNQYIYMFNGNPAYKFNNESLFELNVDSNSMGGYGVYSGAVNSSTINGLIWPPVTFGGYNSNGTPFNGTEGNVQALGYGNEFFHDQNVVRFGYAIGSNYSLVPNPNYNASAGPAYNNQQMIMDPVYKSAALAVRSNKTADPRLYVNALQPWIDSVKFDGVHWALVAKPGMFAGNGNVYGWSVHKYSPVYYNENTGQGNPSGSVSDAWDYYLLRMADVYLLYAEACIGSGDNATGLEYLNRVKRRAYNYPITSPSPVDYTSVSAKTSAINDPVLGNNPLYYERWAELFNEGSWWFDVCRWKIGKSEAQYFGTAINVNGQPFQWDDSKSYVWPIPTGELNANSKITQNPGY
ncbi:MAG TPA: RagB/SusD family nutrient uptake outer membrane protein [Mucilaginibacter sp.]|jgi:hypothetical protein|nr:RagB/SusD family nutrient uptake outer membrane protein [Mucilaginibacter sp.]